MNQLRKEPATLLLRHSDSSTICSRKLRKRSEDFSARPVLVYSAGLPSACSPAQEPGGLGPTAAPVSPHVAFALRKELNGELCREKLNFGVNLLTLDYNS